MPAFDKLAYSDGGVTARPQADLKAYPTRMPDPPATLQAREIELIATSSWRKLSAKARLDHAKCVESGAPTSTPAGIPEIKRVSSCPDRCIADSRFQIEIGIGEIDKI